MMTMIMRITIAMITMSHIITRFILMRSTARIHGIVHRTTPTTGIIIIMIITTTTAIGALGVQRVGTVPIGVRRDTTTMAILAGIMAMAITLVGTMAFTMEIVMEDMATRGITRLVAGITAASQPSLPLLAVVHGGH